MNATHTTRTVRRRAGALIRRNIRTRGDLSRLAELIGVGVPTVMRWRDGVLPMAAHARVILEKVAS